MSSPLTEREAVSIIRLAGKVAQDVLIPALQEHFDNRVYRMEHRLEDRVNMLKQEVEELRRQDNVLLEELQTLKAALQTLAFEKMDVGL